MLTLINESGNRNINFRTNFRARKIIKKMEGHYIMIKRSILKKVITVLNIVLLLLVVIVVFAMCTSLELANSISKYKSQNSVKWLIFIINLTKSNLQEENQIALVFGTYKIYTHFVKIQ